MYACISIIVISLCLFENHLDQSYPTELEIKDKTESNTFTSYLDLFLPIESGGQLFTSLYLERNESNFHITSLPFPTSNIQFSPAYDVLSHNSSDMPGLVPLINVLFWRWSGDFPITFSDRDMSRNVWNRLLRSSTVDTGIFSNKMKSNSPEHYITFCMMTICSDTPYWSDITQTCDPNTLLNFITEFHFLAICLRFLKW